MSPIVVSVAASKLMQEPLPWPKTVAIVVGFIGVLISMNNGERHDAGNWLGYLFALLAMVTGAITQLVLRFLGGHESRESTSFFPRLGPVVACFLACCIFGFEPMSARTVIYSIMIGFVGSFGWFYIAEAYKQSSASSIAPYKYSQIISGAIVGYLVWNDVPNMAVLIGAALIIGAGIYIALHTHRTNIEPPIAEV
jgi:drug/metabolite transporter (DMT)-like permease